MRDSPIFIIALNTFRELVRGKTLYAIIFVSALIVIISALFGSVSVGDPLLVLKDFGLFSISASAVIFAVITGASLLFKELERKTIFNILSKPVNRHEFVIGKFLGMFCTQIVFLVLSSLILAIFASLYSGIFDSGLLIATLFMAMELLIVSAATLFFAALVVTPSLNGLFSFGFFLAGRSVNYIPDFIAQQQIEGSVSGNILESVYYALPHLSKLNVSNNIVFDIAPGPAYTAWAALYAISYASVLLIFASILFSRREFN